MAFRNFNPRTIKCTKCGKQETEKTYGEGFTGWNTIKEVFDRDVDGRIIYPELCPTCVDKFLLWLNTKEKGGK